VGTWGRVQVLLDSGEALSVLDQSTLSAEPTVAVPYHKLGADGAERIVAAIASFVLHNKYNATAAAPAKPAEAKGDAPPQDQGVIAALMQRLALRVLSGLLDRPTLCALFVEKGHAARLAALALECSPALAGAGPGASGSNVANLHDRVLALDVFERGFLPRTA